MLYVGEHSEVLLVLRTAEYPSLCPMHLVESHLLHNAVLVHLGGSLKQKPVFHLHETVNKGKRGT